MQKVSDVTLNSRVSIKYTLGGNGVWMYPVFMFKAMAAGVCPASCRNEWPFRFMIEPKYVPDVALFEIWFVEKAENAMTGLVGHRC